MEIPSTVATYLSSSITKSPELQPIWSEISDLYHKKLWHQLTLKLQECLNQEAFKAATSLLDLHDKFLQDFKTRINPLALAELCVPISEQIVANDEQDATKKAVQLLEENKTKYSGRSKEAVVLYNTTIGMIYLTFDNDRTKTREIVETTEAQVNELSGVTSVHARFYQLSSRYYQITGQHADYHREALRYLGCVDLADLTAEKQRGWAFSIGLAAILGEGIYNFGELLTHDILKSLVGSPESWLIDLLNAFNHGDIAQLDALRPKWSSQTDLVQAEDKLKDKVKLLCLVEMIFRRPTNQRVIPFKTIATATQFPLDQIEHFLMRALCLGLIKGRIDQIDETISVTWLQPRVLDREQIGSMRARLNEWYSAVDSMKQMVESKTKAILA